MKKKIMIALIIALTILMTGCHRRKHFIMSNYSDCRFEEVYNQDFGTLGRISVIEDKQTGVKYIYTSRGYGAGMCELKENK